MMIKRANYKNKACFCIPFTEISWLIKTINGVFEVLTDELDFTANIVEYMNNFELELMSVNRIFKTNFV